MEQVFGELFLEVAITAALLRVNLRGRFDKTEMRKDFPLHQQSANASADSDVQRVPKVAHAPNGDCPGLDSPRLSNKSSSSYGPVKVAAKAARLKLRVQTEAKLLASSAPRNGAFSNQFIEGMKLLYELEPLIKVKPYLTNQWEKSNRLVKNAS